MNFWKNLTPQRRRILAIAGGVVVALVVVTLLRRRGRGAAPASSSSSAAAPSGGVDMSPGITGSGGLYAPPTWTDTTTAPSSGLGLMTAQDFLDLFSGFQAITQPGSGNSPTTTVDPQTNAKLDALIDATSKLANNATAGQAAAGAGTQPVAAGPVTTPAARPGAAPAGGNTGAAAFKQADAKVQAPAYRCGHPPGTVLGPWDTKPSLSASCFDVKKRGDGKWVAVVKA